MKCTYDTGSMYGCVPVCDREASQTVTYYSPCYGAFTSHVCPMHLGPTLGRIYPYEYTLTPLS